MVLTAAEAVRMKAAMESVEGGEVPQRGKTRITAGSGVGPARPHARARPDREEIGG